MSKLDGNWSWLVSHEVLQVADGDIVVHKSEIVTLDLSKLGSDWSWLVSDQVLEMSSGDVVVH